MHLSIIIVKAIAILTAAFALFFTARLPFTSSPVRYYDPPQAHDVDVALRRMALTPESLAAAGVTAVQVPDVIQDAWDALDADSGLIAREDEAVADAKERVQRLTKLVVSGQATEQQVIDCQTAIADLATAETSRDAIFDQLFSGAVGSLPRDSQDVLAQLQTNEEWNMPTEFKVIERANWVRLREALANERIAAKRGEDPDSTDQTFLTGERSDVAVALARVKLDANLAGVQAAWDQTLSGSE